MNHEVTHRSFGRPDAKDIAPVVELVSPAVESETQEVDETLATNAPEGVDEAPALPVDETPVVELVSPAVETVAPTGE
jgi:hypothetical protein